MMCRDDGFCGTPPVYAVWQLPSHHLSLVGKQATTGNTDVDTNNPNRHQYLANQQNAQTITNGAIDMGTTGLAMVFMAVPYRHNQ